LEAMTLGDSIRKPMTASMARTEEWREATNPKLKWPGCLRPVLTPSLNPTYDLVPEVSTFGIGEEDGIPRV
jgi:hypothetical protein